MTIYEKITRGFEIFNNYEHHRYVAADHDRIWSGPPASEVSVKDHEELLRLDWVVDESIDRFSMWVS